MAVKALVFDVFGTVVDWRGSLIAELGAWRPGLDAAGFADAWRGEYKPSMERVRRGEVGWTNLDALHRASLETVLARFGVAGVGAGEMDWLVRAWHRLRPWPDVVAGLVRLKAGFVISPLSNGNVALLVNMAKGAGLPWDLVLCAEVFRHYKPDVEVYLGAAALLGLSPGEVMLCAAHNADLAAARECGLGTAFIARPLERGVGQTVDLRAEGDWDFVVGGVGELAERLGC